MDVLENPSILESPSIKVRLPLLVLPSLVLVFAKSLVPLIARDTGIDAFYAD